MSTRNQLSDTSRVVKNPLLNAVAGSIDDFVNNSILLPAAEIPTPVIEEQPIVKGDCSLCLLILFSFHRIQLVGK